MEEWGICLSVCLCVTACLPAPSLGTPLGISVLGEYMGAKQLQTQPARQSRVIVRSGLHTKKLSKGQSGPAMVTHSHARNWTAARHSSLARPFAKAPFCRLGKCFQPSFRRHAALGRAIAWLALR